MDEFYDDNFLFNFILQIFGDRYINMRFVSRDFVFSVPILVLLFATPCLCSFVRTENKIKSAVFLSPKFELGPGSVINRYFYGIDFPKGHIAVKSFNSEVVDEAGHSVPLHETYLHHWLVARYYQHKHVTHTEFDSHRMLQDSNHVLVRNNGLCQGNVLRQYFGVGSETRRTETHIPDPFGIEIGNPKEIPEGFEDKWLVNIHAIDTRGTEDKLGCTECKCDLYNVTVDEYGPDYKGGMLCCSDYAQCKLKEGFEGAKRSLYLRYTVKWVDWDDSVVPVKIYVIDVTDTLKLSDDNSEGINSDHNCK
ncbi:hypothetical protein RYX36_035351, partial [Vicia faba]